MKRRSLLYTLAAMPAAAAVTPSRKAGQDLHNPYAGVDWATCTALHSMSHQHQGQTDPSRDLFHAMGYRHFAFSNYYPSAPTYPLPAAYLSRHPDLVTAPNAEHHSFTDTGLHANALGSLLTTGYGSSLNREQRAASPLLHRFESLNVFGAARPWLGVYRLDLTLTAVAGAGEKAAEATLTIEGATECDFRDNFMDKSLVRDRPLAVGSHVIFLRTTAPILEVRLTYDKTKATVSQCRLMQGSNRPWRDVFRAALDGETVDGRRSGGLLHADGGGITLNHPTRNLEDYTAMLDFDPRVLGIEVWNQLTSGFGSNQGFYDTRPGPHLHFYQLWDDLLRSGRRCWGFFVKDHNTLGRGRNILLVPGAGDLPAAEREANALRAYRTGAFFGAVSALAANEAGESVPPHDHSDFRFSRITVRRDAAGQPLAIEVAVTGNDLAKRPNVQLRFITDQGIAHIADAPQAEFPLPRDTEGRLTPLFVRIEAIAYPATHLGGASLTAEKMRALNVYDISQLHDRKSARGAQFTSNGPQLRTPIPIADLIFSQPLRRV